MRLAYFSETSPEIAAKADALVREIERQYRAGAVKLGFSPDAIARYMLLGTGAAIPSIREWFTSAQEKTIQANFQKLGDHIKKWKTVYRGWAEQGRNDRGGPYTWATWIDFGANTIASEIQLLSRESWNSSVAIALANATAKTAQDVAELVKKIAEGAGGMLPKLPETLKWIAIAIAVGGAAYILSPLIIVGRRKAKSMAGYGRRRLR